MSMIKTAIDELIGFTGEEGGEDNIVDTLTGSARYWADKKPDHDSYTRSTRSYKFSRKKNEMVRKNL